MSVIADQIAEEVRKLIGERDALLEEFAAELDQRKRELDARESELESRSDDLKTHWLTFEANSEALGVEHSAFNKLKAETEAIHTKRIEVLLARETELAERERRIGEFSSLVKEFSRYAPNGAGHHESKDKT